MLTLELSDLEMAQRRAAWTPPPSAHQRGWSKLYIDNVQQADLGADFDVLGFGPASPEPEIN